MNEAKESAAKGLLISLLIIWVCAACAYLIIDPLFDAHIARVEAEYGRAWVFFGDLTPSYAVSLGIFLSLLCLPHWILSGLFGKGKVANAHIANGLMVLAMLASLLSLFENGSQTFYDFSVFCRSGEPTVVILVDEVYQCQRSMIISQSLMWTWLLSPILATPIRVIESRRAFRKI